MYKNKKINKKILERDSQLLDTSTIITMTLYTLKFSDKYNKLHARMLIFINKILSYSDAGYIWPDECHFDCFDAHMYIHDITVRG